MLFHYTAERAALDEIARQTFEALRAGVIRVDVRHRYPLAAAAEAHRDLEGRRTTGPAGAAAVGPSAAPGMGGANSDFPGG